MPYKTLSDLPTPVKSHLPKHAQEIYLSAFNNAYKEYQKPSKKRDPKETAEQVAHKVAWSAVEKKYKKQEGGNWIEK